MWGSNGLGSVRLAGSLVCQWGLRFCCIRLKSLLRPMFFPPTDIWADTPNTLSNHGWPGRLWQQNSLASLPYPTVSYQNSSRNRFACKGRVISRGWGSAEITHSVSCPLKFTSGEPSWAPQKSTDLSCTSLPLWGRHFWWPTFWKHGRDCAVSWNIRQWTWHSLIFYMLLHHWSSLGSYWSRGSQQRCSVCEGCLWFHLCHFERSQVQIRESMPVFRQWS